MRFRREKGERVRFGIAPLIDIVFLLLIFFMVTSHFDVATGVRIKLPKVETKSFNQTQNKVSLLIDTSGQTYFEGKKMDEKALFKRLSALVKERHRVNLILFADKETHHGAVVRSMDLAKRAGISSIIIAAKWKTEFEF